MEKKNRFKSKFKGFQVAEQGWEQRTFTCQGCPNVCRITQVKFPGEPPLFYGARCDRYETRLSQEARLPNLFQRRNKLVLDPEGEQESLAGLLTYPPSGKAKGRVGVPRALLTWELFPFFLAFLRELGWEVVLSPATSAELVRDSLALAPSTACLPAKVVQGHVRALLEAEVDVLFLPALVDAAHPNTRTKTNYNCPLVQAQPYIIRASFEFSGREVITDPLHFYRPELAEGELLGLARKLGGNGRAALAAADALAKRVREKLLKLGEEALGLVATGELGVVILSRLYNGCDEGLNLGVPEKLLRLGVLPIPLDLLPWEEEPVDPRYPFMQWHAGKRILAAAEIVRRTPDLWAIYLTHFGCGPDSFIHHYVREALAGKPFLTLELDEHSADAGVVTRLEAYLDSVGMLREKPRPQPPRPLPRPREAFDRHKTIYLPYMCDHNYALQATLRHFGYRAETLPPPDQESLALGRKYATGGECLPFIITTGDFLKLVQREDFEPEKACLFMATSTGPCRFCHYFAAQKMILRRLGYEVDFIALEAYGGYTIRDLGTEFRRTAWHAVAAVDLLQKLLWRVRPYEVEPGSADRAYQEALAGLQEALIQGGRRGLLATLPELVRKLQAVPQRPQNRPLIGIVGEIYVRANPFSNANLVRLLEELGAEVRIAPTGEWLSYTLFKRQGDARLRRDYLTLVKTKLERWVLRGDEHRLGKRFAGALPDWEREEPLTEEVVAQAEPYISEAYRGEPVLTVGKAIDYACKGFDGIVNVMPFSCMPGTMVAAVSRRVKRDWGIPWLNLTFDGQEQTHLRTRLEAFLHQAQLHRQAREKAP